MISLGTLKIKNPFILAPMSMYSDICLRQICRDYGASYAFTDLFHVDKFIEKKENLKRFDMFDKDIGIQFLTRDPAKLKQAIEMVNNAEFYPNLNNITSIDLNLGCPTPSITGKCMGSGLLNDPERVRQLFQVMNKHSDFPVSAKLRLGMNAKDKKKKPYLKIAKIAEQENIDFITVHGRTADQAYSESADFKAIIEAAQSVNIPVIANGGIDNEKKAEHLLKYCKAVMIGLPAVYNPFIFKEILYFKENKKKIIMDRIREKKLCIRKYDELSKKYGTGFQHYKIHMQGFLKGMPGSQQTINSLTHTKTIGEIESLMKPFV